MISEHMGKLHAYEQVLVLLLAFGPVLLLAVTIYVARKRLDDVDTGDTDDTDDTGGRED